MPADPLLALGVEDRRRERDEVPHVRLPPPRLRLPEVRGHVDDRGGLLAETRLGPREGLQKKEFRRNTISPENFRKRISPEYNLAEYTNIWPKCCRRLTKIDEFWQLLK